MLGQSGSGKSTLLNLLAGFDRPTSGSVLVQGSDLAKMSSEELAGYRRNDVGMVFQSFHLIPTMTITENVELPMRFAEVDRAERAQRVRESLERVGLGQAAGASAVGAVRRRAAARLDCSCAGKPAFVAAGR